MESRVVFLVGDERILNGELLLKYFCISISGHGLSLIDHHKIQLVIGYYFVAVGQIIKAIEQLHRLLLPLSWKYITCAARPVCVFILIKVILYYLNLHTKKTKYNYNSKKNLFKSLKSTFLFA